MLMIKLKKKEKTSGRLNKNKDHVVNSQHTRAEFTSCTPVKVTSKYTP